MVWLGTAWLYLAQETLRESGVTLLDNCFGMFMDEWLDHQELHHCLRFSQLALLSFCPVHLQRSGATDDRLGSLQL